MKKESLDKRICDVEIVTTNTDTYREFLQQSIERFEIGQYDLDNLSDEELTDLLDFIDDLWDK